MADVDTAFTENGFEIAVIGMAGRFPGAPDIEVFWENLCAGVESISRFDDAELLAAGVDPALLNAPNYVKSAGVLDDADLFDAAFFGCSRREARIMDPQQRLFLETTYQALQHAGCDPQRYAQAIGVFAGVGANTYARLADTDTDAMFDSMQSYLGNDRNFLSTRVSYKLNLRGPSLTIQTACSTSLVAAHMAYQSLLSGECDVALAGGVAVNFPQKQGYFYIKEGILSPDGHCRAFDASAAGTVGGEGVGVVVLKRYEDAVAEGDCIHAIIKGSALNNDGSRKVGYTAPSVAGQADVIRRAQEMAEVEADSIGYVETHGTGTQLGDPIEFAALQQAFRSRGSEMRQACAIGSVKTNIGHLDTAAGIASLIKTVLILKHRKIPPSLHYREANPQIDFAQSPFFVNQELRDWGVGHRPLRAGVSSFGMGGSNAHMVLEAAPEPAPAAESPRRYKLLTISAVSDAALLQSSAEIAAQLQQHPEQSLDDVAFTLNTGRQQFSQRRILVAETAADAIAALESGDARRLVDRAATQDQFPVVFMFPGQGSQHLGMGQDLYQFEAGYRQAFDQCCDYLQPIIGLDLRDLLFGEASDDKRRQLEQTALTQPALFAVEYALAQLWISWGIKPEAMIGHSIGEYVAACIAGVISLTDALTLVAARAALMQSLESGSMVSVDLPAQALGELLTKDLSVAAINLPSMCVLSGPDEAVGQLESELNTRSIEYRRLHTSHAFHSSMMEPVLQAFAKLLRAIEFAEPRIPYLSNLSGDWITREDLLDPDYWCRHLRETVQFSAGIERLCENPQRLFLEVGPGQTLCSLLRSNPAAATAQTMVASMRHPQSQVADDHQILTSLGRLWLAGIDLDWSSYYRDEKRRRCPLPGYPFERQRFWIDASATARQKPSALRGAVKIPDPGQWYYALGWKSAVLSSQPRDSRFAGRNCLVFADGSRLSDDFVDALRTEDCKVTVVTPGRDYARLQSDRFTLKPGRRDDMNALFEQLRASGQLPERIVHLWSVAPAETDLASDQALQQSLAQGFYSLLDLVQLLAADASADPVELIVVSAGTQSVSGEETLYPPNAGIVGLCRVIPQEQDRIRCRMIDLEISRQISAQEQLARRLLAEMNRSVTDALVALRHRSRWIQSFDPLALAAPEPAAQYLRQRGVYLICGGLGKIGLCLAEYLAKTVSARLVLIGRSELPPRDSWDDELARGGVDIGRKITAIRELEQAGAEVLPISADITDEAQMREALERAVERFGKIDGVVHAAASADAESFQLLRDLDSNACERQFMPKFKGLLVLSKLLKGQNPDFCILMSSLAAILGGLRFGAYAAANAILDCYARADQDGMNWISVNWDGWQFATTASGDVSAVARQAMTASEGIEVFARLPALQSISQVAISTSDLNARFEQWVAPVTAAKDSSPGKITAAHQRKSKQLAKLDLTESGIQSRLVEIWSELLGVESIGAEDNFFDLGGDSLLALQVASRLREALVADLSAATVLEAPTIAQLTQQIMKQHQSLKSSDQATEMLQRIKNISPEERERLLVEARKAQGAAG